MLLMINFVLNILICFINYTTNAVLFFLKGLNIDDNLIIYMILNQKWGM